MSDPVMIALIVSAPTFLTALGSLIVSILNRQRLKVVHEDVNGKMQQLIEARQAESRAVGETEGRQKAIDEQAARLAIKEQGEDRVADKQA